MSPISTTPVTVWLSDEEADTMRWMAKARRGTMDDVLAAWMRPVLDEHVRLWREYRWRQRRKALETDATLATTVDAAVEAD